MATPCHTPMQCGVGWDVPGDWRGMELRATWGDWSFCQIKVDSKRKEFGSTLEINVDAMITIQATRGPAWRQGSTVGSKKGGVLVVTKFLSRFL
jgi:hypothetical protein